MSLRRFVIVTGLSGAGKSQAMKSFEDLGFYCLDNLPPALLPQVVKLANDAAFSRIAIAPDVRTMGMFGDALEAVDAIARIGYPAEILFLDASDETLVRRYSETRRKHPFASRGHLTAAIGAERAALGNLRARADLIWDTTTLTLGQLKERIAHAFMRDPDEHRLAVNLIAFGFKYGLPLDADLVFDVRFLPNPYYSDELRPLTGADAPVAAYLEAIPQTAAFLEHLEGLLDFLIPEFIHEGKSALTIAIGCTGGRHRSVYLARRIQARLTANAALDVQIVNRDLGP